ncbi:hypothetical protein [Arsenicibacter rosenii]|uniref:hypothetical protein n=1 Tax=Arsenicibacter rosenii TaxID=1750698 RepID=UPI0015A661F9|nr:hypothetical protein [Arsenicibacter rosenii]
MKEIKLLTDQKIHFSVGSSEVELSESMPIEVAEKIAAQYPGVFLEVIEKKNSPAESEG